MPIKNNMNSKRKFQSLICVSMIFIISLIAIFFTIKVKTTKPSLQLMKLRQDTKPTFTLGTQISYTSHLVTDFNTSNMITSDKPFNISVMLNTTKFDTNTLVNDLSQLPVNQSIFVSLIPDVDVLSTEEYIALCQSISTACTTSGLSNVQLIWYPIPHSNYSSYKDLDIENVGIIITSLDDLHELDKLNSLFGNSVTYFAQDYLALNYTNQEKDGAKAIYLCYYDLAVNYPYISTVFCPYLSLPISNYVADTLDQFNNIHESVVYSEYYSGAYQHILEQPWTTTKYLDISAQSPFEHLDEYSTLNGTEQLIISPNSPVFEEIVASNTLRLVYRINNTDITVQSYAPYLTSIDTNKFPNGINRFKLLGYDIDSNVVLSPSNDFVINNDNLTTRAIRKPTNYTTAQQPIYTTDYIPILMYHTISDVVAEEDQNSCVTTTNFDAQMKALIDNGYTSITFLDLWHYLNGTAGLPEKPILITMDDGYLNNYTHAYPIYKKYGISATLFVSPFYMKTENTERHFGWNAAKEMEESGLIDIESHGYDHTPFPRLSTKDLMYHISHARGLLEQNLGQRDVFTVACPQFRNNYFTRKTLTNQGVNFQITKLAKRGTVLTPSSLKRINVPNTMSPDELITTITSLTMS